MSQRAQPKQSRDKEKQPLKNDFYHTAGSYCQDNLKRGSNGDHNTDTFPAKTAGRRGSGRWYNSVDHPSHIRQSPLDFPPGAPPTEGQRTPTLSRTSTLSALNYSCNSGGQPNSNAAVSDSHRKVSLGVVTRDTGEGDNISTTISQVEGCLDDSVLMNPSRFANLKNNLEACMTERQRELTAGTGIFHRLHSVSSTSIRREGSPILTSGGMVAPMVGVPVTSVPVSQVSFKPSSETDIFHPETACASSKGVIPTSNPNPNPPGGPEMSFGNFGFGSSVRVSAEADKEGGDWCGEGGGGWNSQSQSCVLYRALEGVGLSCLYDKRSHIKICVFSLLAIMASFLYLTPGHQIQHTSFFSLTAVSPTSRVQAFPSDSGQVFHEASFALTGLFQPVPTTTTSPSPSYPPAAYDVIRRDPPHLRLRLCNMTSLLTSFSTSRTGRECFAEKNFTLLPVGSQSQSAETVRWSSGLQRRVQHTALYVELHNSAAFSFMLDFSLSGDASRLEVGVAGMILLLFYLLVITEVFHRTVAAMLSSTVALAALSVMGKAPRIHDVMRWIEWETLMLLFGMMILVAIFAESGFFDRVSLLAFRVARGRVWALVCLLCCVTGTTSAVLDNVSTILLMAPVALNLCQVLHVDPKWLLIAQVLFSNIGGTATAIGDLPNVLIVSNETLKSRGIGVTSFSAHLCIGSFLAGLAAMATLKVLYRNKKFGSVQDAEIRAWETELRMWRQTMARVGSISREEKAVRGMLMVHMGNLWARMNTHPHPHNTPSAQQQEAYFRRRSSSAAAATGGAGGGKYLWQVPSPGECEQQRLSCEVEVWRSKYEELKQTYVIRDHSLLAKSGLLIVAVVLMFVLQSASVLHTELGVVAIFGAIVLLLLTDIDDIEDILHKVEWATLIFFAAEFVLMQALREMRMLETVASVAADAVDAIHPDMQFPVALLLMLWLSALASSLIDNIPFTKTMIPILISLCDRNPNIHLKPMVYALAFGACLGGNGTVIGASANVVCAGIAENKGTKISFFDFFHIGFPVMLVTSSVAMCYLVTCHLFCHWDNT